MRNGRGGRAHDRNIRVTRPTHSKRTITNHLRPSDNRLHDITRIRLIVRDSGPPADFDQSREDRSANLVRLAPLAGHAPFYELDLSWVEGTRKFGYESTIKSVHRTACGGCRPVEHPREVIRGFENTGDRVRGLLGHLVPGVQLENCSETWHVLIKNHLRHLGSESFDGRREGLTSPHGGHGRVAWRLGVSPSNSNGSVGPLTSKNMFVYPRQLNVRLLRVRHNQTIHDSLCDGLGDRVPQEVLDLHRGSVPYHCFLFWREAFVDV